MEQYVVILYASKGPNQAVKPPLLNDKAWIANFGHLLSVLYQQIARKPLTVYFVSDVDRQHADKIRQAGLLFVLVTPDLQGHPDLVSMSDEYLTQRQQEIVVAGKYRFVKIMRRPAPVGDIFPNERHIPSYRFFKFDRLSNTHSEFLPAVSAETSKAYWLKLMDATQNVLHVFESGAQRGAPVGVSTEKTVFLADVADDMIFYRDVLRREMEYRGYRVLPQVTRLSQAALEKGTLEDLRKSSISLHLVGEQYGRLMEQKSRSIVEYENEIAHKHLQSVLQYNKTSDKAVKFHRLIWLKPNSRYFDERQKVFVGHLRNEAATVQESEVLEVDLQELQATLFAKLSSFAGAEKSQEEENGAVTGFSVRDKPSVYLIHDPQDKEEVASVAEVLIDSGLAVLSLPSEHDPHALRVAHQRNLSHCDASLIYLHRSSPNWLNTKLQDVMKAPAFGRSRPMRGSAVLLNSDAAAYKSLDKYITVIRPHDGAFTRSVLAPFIGRIK